MITKDLTAITIWDLISLKPIKSFKEDFYLIEAVPRSSSKFYSFILTKITNNIRIEYFNIKDIDVSLGNHYKPLKITYTCFSYDCKYGIRCCRDNALRIFNLQTTEIEQILLEHEEVF